MEVSLIIDLLLSASGFLIVARIFGNFADKFSFSKRLSTYSFLFLAGLALGGYFFLHEHPFVLWLFIGIILLSLNFFPEILQIALVRELKKQILPLMDQVLLGLQTGLSFRASLAQAIQTQPAWARRQHLEIYNSIVMNRAPGGVQSLFLDEIRTEFAEMDRASAKVIEHARAFRRQMKMEEDFRRRSGQVSQQIRLQAIIVTFLYLALLIYVISQFGFFAHLRLIFLSSALFFGGLVLIFVLGRRLKWKL